MCWSAMFTFLVKAIPLFFFIAFFYFYSLHNLLISLWENDTATPVGLN